MDTANIWNAYKEELFFFTLKRVKKQDSAEEILQNAFLKIHNNLHKLEQKSKLRAWVYQIVRNEIVNFRKRFQSELYETDFLQAHIEDASKVDTYCCFERFVEGLPDKFRSVVVEVYLEGKTQQETAEALGITLANTKARIRHAKTILKENFQQCCNYELNSQGLLSGEPDCSTCS